MNPKLTGRAKWVLQPKDIERERQKEEEKRKKKEEEKKKKEEERRKKEEEKKAEEDDTQKKEETYETPEKLLRAVFSVLTVREGRCRFGGK